MSTAENAATDTRTALAAAQAAERRVTAAAGPAADAGARRADVAVKLTAKKAERTAIAVERAAGNFSPDHAGLLATIDMDITALEGMLVERDDIANTFKAAHTATQRDLEKATVALEQAKAHEKAALLIDHAKSLTGALVSTTQRLGDQLSVLDAIHVRDAIGGLIAFLVDQQAAVVATVDMVANVRRQHDSLVQPWHGHPGFESVPGILRHQLRMQ